MIVTADLHFGLVSDSPIKEDSRLLSDKTPWKIYDSVHLLREMIVAAAADDGYLIICGDIFHVANPKSEIIKLFLDQVEYANLHGVKMIIFAGNHDCKRYFSALEIFKNTEGIMLFRNGVWNIPIKSNKRFLGVFKDHFSTAGYHGNRVRVHAEESLDYHKAYEESGTSVFPALFSHASYSGFAMFNMYPWSDVSGYESGNALEYDPTQNIDGSNKELHTFFPFVFLGHIHKHYLKQYGNQIIVSPGSPLINDYAEAHDPKGYIRFSPIHKKCEFVKFKHQQKQYDTMFIDLTRNPDFTMTDDKIEDIRGKVLRVQVLVGEFQNPNERWIRDYVGDYAYISQFCVTPLREQRSIIEPGSTVMKKLDHAELLTTWVNNSADIELERKPTVIKMGKEILEEVE